MDICVRKNLLLFLDFVPSSVNKHLINSKLLCKIYKNIINITIRLCVYFFRSFFLVLRDTRAVKRPIEHSDDIFKMKNRCVYKNALFNNFHKHSTMKWGFEIQSQLIVMRIIWQERKKLVLSINCDFT